MLVSNYCGSQTRWPPQAYFNSKSCNEAVLFRHFKMDTLSTVINLIRPGVYMASFDLKHAYYTIPIAAEHRKYLEVCLGRTSV